MIRTALRRRAALPRAAKFNNSRCSFKGERFDSRLECAAYEMLTRQQAAGEIRNLRRQVRHELYLKHGNGAVNWYTGAGHAVPIMGWCSCSAPGVPAPDGFHKFRGVRLDFEYEEATATYDDTAIGRAVPTNYEPRFADAKGFVQRDGGQFYAYIIFELIHGRPIRLIKKGDIR